MTNLTDREKWALKYMIDFNIYRYMMCNAFNREDGAEKADNHIKISKILVQFITCKGGELCRNSEPQEVLVAWLAVHDYLAKILTDRMDEVIGYPIGVNMYGDDFRKYADKFFDVIIDHFDEIVEIVNKTLENEL